MKPLLKFMRLSNHERRCLLLATLVLNGIRFGLWRVPFNQLWKRIQRLSQAPPSWIKLIVSQPPTVAEMIWAVDVSSWYALKPARCLARAFTLYLLMQWFGHVPTLRIGVAKPNESTDNAAGSPKPAIEAHAWIEYQDQIILGQIRDLERFAPLPSIEQV